MSSDQADMAARNDARSVFVQVDAVGAVVGSECLDERNQVLAGASSPRTLG